MAYALVAAGFTAANSPERTDVVVSVMARGISGFDKIGEALIVAPCRLIKI
jgi:hypothetical protein